VEAVVPIMEDKPYDNILSTSPFLSYQKKKKSFWIRYWFCHFFYKFAI